MLKDRRIVLFWLFVAVCAIWIDWWGSSGFPLQHQICGDTADPNNCPSYNVILYSAWRLAKTADQWSALIAAIATGLIACFAWTLWQANEKMWRTTNEAIQLATNEFVTVHRPKMRLKLIWLASPDGQESDPNLVAGKPISARLDIVNTGDARAFVRLINFMTRLVPAGERLPQRPPYHQEQGNLDHRFVVDAFLESGVTLTASVNGQTLSQNDIRRIRSGETRLYCIGTIDYRDIVGQPRQTAFCRSLTFGDRPARDGDTGRFQEDNNESPDYEYQD